MTRILTVVRRVDLLHFQEIRLMTIFATLLGRQNLFFFQERDSFFLNARKIEDLHSKNK